MNALLRNDEEAQLFASVSQDISAFLKQNDVESTLLNLKRAVRSFHA